MILEKYSMTYELTDETQISAFINSGWKEVKAKKAAKEEKDGSENGATEKPNKKETTGK